MRILLLFASYEMPDIVTGLLDDVRRRLCEIDFEVRVLNGKRLNYSEALDLLKQGLDCIVLNLRLPDALSIRMAELVHLTKASTRLFLISEAPTGDGPLPAVPLFDAYLPCPFYKADFVRKLCSILDLPFLTGRTRLPSQEHLDSAILDLMSHCPALISGHCNPLSAFALYRDTYLHRREEPKSTNPVARASPAERLEYYAQVEPLNLSARMNETQLRSWRSPFYQEDQKRLLITELGCLKGLLGLTLTNFRAEIDDLLDGLEQFGRMIEGGTGEAYLSPVQLKESLLARSEMMPEIHEHVSRILNFLPEPG